MPFSLAAIWARRSATLVAGSRDGYSAVFSSSVVSASRSSPVLYQQPVVDQHPLLLDLGAGGRHGSRRHPADLGVVAAAGHVEPDVVAASGGEDRGDHGDVGQVGAAVVGVVEDVDVAAADPAGVALDHHLDGLAHGAEVHRHVRGVGDQAAVGVEDRAGEVEPLLDVDRVRGGLQAHAHLFGYRHEQVVEDLQHHRVGGRADVRPVRPRGDAGQQQVAAAGHHGLPARLDHGGGQFLGDDGRAVDDVPGPAARPARTGPPRPRRRR